MKAFHSTRRAIVWLGGREPVVLVSLFLIVAGSWIFIEVADEVVEGESRAFDRMVVKAMRQEADPKTPIGPGWVQEAGRDITALGGIAWLVFFTLAVAGYLWLDQRHRLTYFLLAAATSGWILSSILKNLFDRPRPDVVPHLSHVATSSFPSGHSMVSAVVYLTLGTFLAAVSPRPRLKVYVLTIAVLITVAVGVSRVYLGVHYPTDVLAGWCAGLVWALGCWLLARWLRRRGKVESPEPE